MIKGAILKAVRQAPSELAQGILDLISAPPKRAVELWDGLSPEDKELFKKAAISGARLAAKAVIAADKGGKASF